MTIFKEFTLLGRLLGLTFEEAFEYYNNLYKNMVQTGTGEVKEMTKPE